MSRVRVESFTISLDGFGAGPAQGLDHPLGMGGEDLHRWMFTTRTAQKMVFNADAGESGTTDDDYARRGFENMGAWILGRNMFGPVRGPWPDHDWKGWWGDEPPYHCPVFVLTHHARPPLEMAGGTAFHFVTDGIEAALDLAKAAAGGKDVRIGGGAATIRQYLSADLVDELHIAVAPIVLGSGESLFEGIDLRALGLAVVEYAATEHAAHFVLRK